MKEGWRRNETKPKREGVTAEGREVEEERPKEKEGRRRMEGLKGRKPEQLCKDRPRREEERPT